MKTVHRVGSTKQTWNGTLSAGVAAGLGNGSHKSRRKMNGTTAGAGHLSRARLERGGLRSELPNTRRLASSLTRREQGTVIGIDQLTAVSGKIEAVEQEMEKAHARVKDQINAPKQPRITGVTNLLKEAGVTLSPDQTGALTKFFATVGDQDLDVPSLWKAEAELLDSDWFSQEANGRHGEYGPSRNDHRTRSNPLSRRGPPRVRERC